MNTIKSGYNFGAHALNNYNYQRDLADILFANSIFNWDKSKHSLSTWNDLVYSVRNQEKIIGS